MQRTMRTQELSGPQTTTSLPVLLAHGVDAGRRAHHLTTLHFCDFSKRTTRREGLDAVLLSLLLTSAAGCAGSIGLRQTAETEFSAAELGPWEWLAGEPPCLEASPGGSQPTPIAPAEETIENQRVFIDPAPPSAGAEVAAIAQSRWLTEEPPPTTEVTTEQVTERGEAPLPLARPEPEAGRPSSESRIYQDDSRIYQQRPTSLDLHFTPTSSGY